MPWLRACFLFLPALPVVAEVRFGLETGSFPLLPSFYEPATRKVHGLTIAFPVLPEVAVHAGLFRGHPYIDFPYNDVSNYHSSTLLLRAGAEYQAFQAGPLRLFLGGGLAYFKSSWYADDHAYEDPDEPRDFWEGRFSRWAVEGVPRLELFREKQKVDWTLSFSLPYFLGFGARLQDKGESVERIFRQDYLKRNAGLGYRISIGVAIGP